MNGFLDHGYSLNGIEGQSVGTGDGGREGEIGGVGTNGASSSGGYHNIVSTSSAFEWGLNFP